MADVSQELQAKITWDDEGAADGLQTIGQSAASVGDIISGIIISDILINFYNQIVSLGTAAIQSSASLQNIGIAARYAFGSDSAANQMLTTLNQISAQTPFTNEQLATLAVRMQNMGVPTQQITGSLQSLATVASATGTNFQDMSGILQSSGDILALAFQRGSIMSLQLRSIANQGIPIYQALAEVTGKPLHDFLTTSKTFQISASDLQKAFVYLADTKFAGAASEQANSYTGVLKNLNQQFQETIDAVLGVSQAGEVTKGGLFDILQQSAAQLLNYLSAHKTDIVQFGQTIITIFVRQVGPAIQTALSWINNHGSEIGALVQGIAIDIANMIAFVVQQAIPAITAFIGWIVNHKDQILQFFNNLYVIVADLSVLLQGIVQALNSVANVGGSIVNTWNAATATRRGGIQGAFADGVTNFSGGLALVGENGPEVVNLPGGSSVTPNDQIGNTVNIYNPVVRSQSDVQNIIQQVKQALGRQNELSRLGAI